MEYAMIKFTKPTLLPNMGAYRVGEIAKFSRQVADKIVKRGHGEIYEKPAGKPGPKKKVMDAGESGSYATK